VTPQAFPGLPDMWLVSLACRKAKDLGYPHELWTTRLLAGHAREHGPAEGHACLAHLALGTVCKILAQEEVKPHKVRYCRSEVVIRAARAGERAFLNAQRERSVACPFEVPRLSRCWRSP
jgi:hypothetical protein